MQSAQSEAYERVRVDMRLDGGHGIRPGEIETKVGEVRYHTPEEEIA
jgi:NAD+ synthase (glutamine-hydrolysing)